MNPEDLASEIERLRSENAALNEQVKLLVQTEQRLYRSQNELDAQLQRIRALAGFSLETSHLESPSQILARGLQVIGTTFAVEWIGALRLSPDAQAATIVGSEAGPELTTHHLALDAETFRWFAEPGEPRLLRRVPGEPTPPPFALLDRLVPGLIPPATARFTGEFACVPLRWPEDDPQPSMLLVFSSHPRPAFLRDGAVVESHLPYLQLLVRHIEHAVESARLTERLRERSAALARSLETLERTQQQLLQAQKMEAVGRLAGGVAHDFNNLLTVMLGYAGGLSATLPSGSPAHDQARHIVEAAKRAAGITSQLLALGRRQIQRPEDLDLSAQVRRTAELLRRLVGEHIRLELELLDTLPPIRADRSQLEQVLLNLIVNARDAMPEGGLMRVVTRRATVQDAEHCAAGVDPAGFAVFEVHDEGVGMDETIRARIFEPFFTTKPAGQGSGLGLSVVYGIVDQSGGHVFVHSTPGRGSTFSVMLPLAKATGMPVSPTAHAPAANAPAPPSEVLTRPTVLVVEDEAAIRGVVKNTLEHVGFRVLLAADGVEALQMLESAARLPDLVLTDVVMPRMGGVRLAEQIAAQRPSLRVVFMSGYAENFEAQLGPGARPVFLAKPFASSELVAFVRSQITSPAPISR